jgi:hypothetical protein
MNATTRRITVRAVICNVVAAMLLLHAFVGCCRHHDCDLAGADREGATQPACGCCCHHEPNECCGDEAPTPNPCDCKGECKALCIYLPTQKCVVDAGNLSLSIDMVCHQCDDLGAILRASAGNLSHHRMSERAMSEPPIRLHLLHQIILI